jgi:hypothetical protein
MRYTTYAFCLFFLGLTTAMAQTNCELKKDKNHIKIYGCPVKGSDLDDIRIECEINSTIEKYIPIVMDVTHYDDWRYRELNHKVLKTISATELIYYAQVSAPFPLRDRDLILHLKLNRDSVTKVLTVTIKSMADYIPQVEDFVRVPSSLSTMTLTPIGESKLKVICDVRANPGGQVPAWVINMFSTTGPYETFKNLTERMEEESDND